MPGYAGFRMVLKIAGHPSVRAQDVTFNAVGAEVDVSTRGGAGWKEFIQGLKEWGFDAPHLYVNDNNQLDALRTAWLSGAELEVISHDPSGQGWKGDAIVSNMGENQALNEGVTVPVTLKGTGPLERITQGS